MPFSKIEGALITSKSHMDSLDQNSPNIAEIEYYLVAGLILLIVSEYELLIETMFVQRADRCGDKHLAQFVRTAIARKFRSPDLSKITEVLSQFGDDYKQCFATPIVNTEYHAAWDNIMRARHAIVHKSGSLNITLAELTTTYPKTKVVIDALKTALNLP